MNGPEWTLTMNQRAYEILVGLAARLDCSKAGAFTVALGLTKACLDARDDGMKVVAIDPGDDDAVAVDFMDLLRRGALKGDG